MLVTLRIENLAIIEKLEMEFGVGLNVLTGETGAGKSIIVGALGLVLGQRAASETVRHGAKEGRVEALFDLSGRPDVTAALEEAGLPNGEDLLIRRVVSRAGRSRVYVNGSLATLQTLARVTGPLVDVSSQHEQYSLMNAATHLRLLDTFGELAPEADKVAGQWRELTARRSELATLRADAADRAARLDYLRFQLEEIDDAALEAGEDDELRLERNRLQNAETLQTSSGEAHHVLYESDGSIVTQLEHVRSLLSRLADLDPAAGPLATRVEEARIEVEDVAYELRAYRDGVESDPRRLADVDERLELIRSLSRKHGPTVADILARREEIAEELGAVETADDRAERLEEEIARLEKALLADARALSDRRRAAAGELEKAVQSNLGSLAMERCRLRVHFADGRAGADALCENGVDRVELRVATNVGEGYKPLAKTASGGELSRILLSLKRALATSDRASTHVFDEVDSGIGGGVAEAVGRLLAETANQHQVLCITHQPQVASFAERHFRVGKEEHDGRTTTKVEVLAESAQVEEIARMLGGAELTKTTREHAREMIERSRA